MELKDCTRSQKRYLHKYVCAWCDQPLDRDWCGAFHEGCPPEVRAKRRADCLSHYRPRAAIREGE